jgi:hypothetical protein
VELGEQVVEPEVGPEDDHLFHFGKRLKKVPNKTPRPVVYNGTGPVKACST